jgi:hypothetical protein
VIRSGITGGAELRRVAANLRKGQARDLTVELRKGQRKAYAPLQAEVKANAAAMLPGAYAAVMAKSVKVSVRSRFSAGAVITARVYARGKAELRDVRAVNAGAVRHPLFARRSRWYVTRITPGFVDLAADRVADRVLSESADAAERVLMKIAKG